MRDSPNNPTFFLSPIHCTKKPFYFPLSSFLKVAIVNVKKYLDLVLLVVTPSVINSFPLRKQSLK